MCFIYPSTTKTINCPQCNYYTIPYRTAAINYDYYCPDTRGIYCKRMCAIYVLTFVGHYCARLVGTESVFGLKNYNSETHNIVVVCVCDHFRVISPARPTENGYGRPSRLFAYSRSGKSDGHAEFESAVRCRAVRMLSNSATKRIHRE